MHRRQFLASSSAALVALGLPLPSRLLAAPIPGIASGPPQPFDFARLKGRARALGAAAYIVPERKLPPAIAALDWDHYQSIRYRKDHALWAGDDTRFMAQFFHPGLFFKLPVRMHEVVDGQAREIPYDPAMFDRSQSGLDDQALPAGLGFAGFRLNRRSDPDRDVAAFLGASYFRAVGAEGQYGQSARGLAVDCGLPTDEEFPDFTEFWLERPGPQSDTVVVHALLDSPGIAGAYRFAITPGDELAMDVDCALYPRRAIERLGIAPCTSMYQAGENDRRMAWDWRPEIHDTDGLALWTSEGEWIWRPLCNPPQLRFNMFEGDSPRGFGLLQRDRDFDHYQDDGVYYSRRPSLWVEPKQDWGPGSVQLIEIPTGDESFDNIVAFWNPRDKPQPGQELLFGYRLSWGAQPPASAPQARCVATRTGLGGRIGFKREHYSQRFVVDFAGGSLAALAARNATIEPVLQASRGRIETVSARPLHEINGYRVMFDAVPPDDGTAQIDLRLYLRDGSGALSETWLYQWTPPAAEQRMLY